MRVFRLKLAVGNTQTFVGFSASCIIVSVGSIATAVGTAITIGASVIIDGTIGTINRVCRICNTVKVWICLI